MPPKSLAAIVSKVDALVKDFADLKVHVVGGRPKEIAVAVAGKPLAYHV